MNDLFTIKQAAEIAGMTSETLRHYDRIGLVKPCCKDDMTGYRYYSEQELVRLQTIDLLKTMEIPLKEIKGILDQKDLFRVVGLLKQAEKNADGKISRLQAAKAKIVRAYTDYEKKLVNSEEKREDFFVRHLPKRVILVSDSLETPTLKNLWGYHSHFYEQVGEAMRSRFVFEDTAGMITSAGKTRLFAVCLEYPSLEGLAVLAEGEYLCANCTEENRVQVLQELLEKAKAEYGTVPAVVLHSIVVTGILQWDYQVQVLLM